MAERDEIPDAKDIPTECDFLRLGEFRDKAKRSVNPARFPDEQFELYSVPSYEAGVPETVPGSEIGSNKISVQPNSVLFCRINPHISRSWVTGNYTKNRKIASTEWVVFPENSTLSPKFLKYFLQTSDFYDYLQMNVSGVGGSLTRARVDAIDDYQFPLPPLPEQHAIVAKIEEPFTQLDAGVAALKRAQANLKRYKASVLKAACEGRLVPTEADLARAEGRDYEPASELLARILKERRARWEADLRAKGKDPAKVKYKEPAAPDTANLPELPEGWCWATVEQVSFVSGGLTKNRKRNALKLKVPYLRVANVYANELRLEEIEQLGVTEGELQRVLLLPSDLLIVEGNGSVDQIGRVALWDGSIEPCAHQNHIIKARFLIHKISKFALFWLLSESGRTHITDVASSTSGLHTLSLSKVNALPIPLPPLSEQDRILSEIELRLSIAGKSKAEFEYTIQRSLRLRQAILRRAFEGRLIKPLQSDRPNRGKMV